MHFCQYDWYWSSIHEFPPKTLSAAEVSYTASLIEKYFLLCLHTSLLKEICTLICFTVSHQDP